MTKEEAKEILENRREIASYELATALDVAIESIDKQIPHEANMISTDYSDGEEVIEYYECPRCGAEYEIEYVGYFKYCPECGQAIEWRKKMTKKEALEDMEERCSICKRESLPPEEECENCYFPIAIDCIKKVIEEEKNDK